MQTDTKETAKKKEEALIDLHRFLPEGSQIFTIVDKVSKSGMSREIRLLVPNNILRSERIYFLHPNYSAAILLGLRQNEKTGALIVKGCGTDLCEYIVERLSFVLYGHFNAFSHDRL